MYVRNAVRNLWTTARDFARNKIVVVAIAHAAVDSLVVVWRMTARMGVANFRHATAGQQ